MKAGFKGEKDLVFFVIDETDRLRIKSVEEEIEEWVSSFKAHIDYASMNADALKAKMTLIRNYDADWKEKNYNYTYSGFKHNLLLRVQDIATNTAYDEAISSMKRTADFIARGPFSNR